jgi:hypothetical protein
LFLVVLALPRVFCGGLRPSSSRAAARVKSSYSSRGGVTLNDVEVPSYGELRRFALPALTLWISGPLLTLIDTSAVGLSAAAGDAGVLEIAALGPATSLCDGAGFLFAFLNIATTNLYVRSAVY